MNRAASVSALGMVVLFAACGGGDDSRLRYTNPEGGALRLVKKSSTEASITLDFVVGSQEKVGYSTGFSLPVDRSLITLDKFEPGAALQPGLPAAANAKLVESGPLANHLITAQSQKAAGDGAVTGNTTLAPGTVLFSITLGIAEGATEGLVFDGTADGFQLPSGGLRDRAGNTVVQQTDVKIGKLELTK